MVDWSRHKAIVFQSDDWGQCYAVPDRDAYEKIKNHYPGQFINNAAATLESAGEMEALFSILRKFTGGDGRPVVFQPNYVMANPDFEYVKATNAYRDVFLPQFPARWERKGIMEKALDGMSEGIWYPELHGCRHYNVLPWIRAVKRREPEALLSLQHCTISYWMHCQRSKIRHPFNGPFYNKISEFGSGTTLRNQERSIDDGTGCFERVFGRTPKSFMAPAWVWQARTERILSRRKFTVVQGANSQNWPPSIYKRIIRKINRIAFPDRKQPRRAMGEYDSSLKLRHLNRNVDFEPTSPSWTLASALGEIARAFENDEPAIISTHRINFVNLDNQKRIENLSLFESLLGTISRKYPEAVYVVDDEICQLYEKGTSVIAIREDELRCRNYNDEITEIEIEYPIEKVDSIYQLPGRSMLQPKTISNGSSTTICFPPGDFEMILKNESRLSSN